MLRKLQAQHLEWDRPAVQPPVPDEVLAEACTLWQGGRDVGSSPIRAAARVLSGVDHYFHADFITAYNQQARTTPEVLAAGRRAAAGGQRGTAPGRRCLVRRGRAAGRRLRRPRHLVEARRGPADREAPSIRADRDAAVGRLPLPRRRRRLRHPVPVRAGRRLPRRPGVGALGDQGRGAGAGDRRSVPGAVAGGARRDHRTCGCSGSAPAATGSAPTRCCSPCWVPCPASCTAP